MKKLIFAKFTLKLFGGIVKNITIKRRGGIFPLLIVSLGCFSSTALRAAILPPLPGNTYFVSTTGSDVNNNEGTITKPFRTFKKAIAKINAGDTIFIRGGLYFEQMDFQSPVRKTGLPNAWIRVSGYQNETVTIRYTDPETNSYGPIKIRGASAYFLFENLTLDGTNGTHGSRWMLRDGNHHFILRKLDIKNFKGSALIIAGNNIQIMNCKFHGSQPSPGVLGAYYGIYFSKGNNVIIEGNEIFDNNGGGIHVFPGPIANAIIRNNIIRNNNSVSNNTAAKSSVPGILIFQNISYNNGTAIINGVNIYNNLVYSNCVSKPIGTCGGIQVSNGASNVKIWNNTVYGQNGYGILVSAGSDGPPINTVVQNNIVFGNSTFQIMNTSLSSVINTNLTTNPLFKNPLAGDFRLLNNSPAINKGVTLPLVPADILGVKRPQGGYDIGAFEYNENIPNPPSGIIVRPEE